MLWTPKQLETATIFFTRTAGSGHLHIQAMAKLHTVGYEEFLSEHKNQQLNSL